MSPHIAVFAPATRVMSRKLGPDLAERLAVLEQPSGGLRGEHVREHVRQVAEHGDEAVVRLGVHGHRPRSHVHHEAVQPLVEQAAGLLVRRQVPDGALEEVGARVLHAGGLGAGDRVAAHEARVGRALHEVLLGRAHVGDERVRPRGVERLAHQLRQHAHRRAGEAELRALDGLGDRRRGAVDGAALDARCAAARGRGRSPRPRRPRRAPAPPGRSSRRSAPRRGRLCARVHPTVVNCFPASSAAASSLRR